MKLIFKCLAPLLFLAITANGQINKIENPPVFPLGNKVTNGNFTGNVWLQMLVLSDTVYNSNIGSVTFGPGARSKWHAHPGGQLLLVTEGKGLYQEKGQPVKLIKKGDVIKCPPNVVHWHGATPSDNMTHIAIGINTQKGNVIWMDYVTDFEYKSFN